MARIRTIKPQFFLNEELAELPAMVRLLFIGLWTQADISGRLVDRPKRIKAELFPYDEFDVDKALQNLADKKFIIRYKVTLRKHLGNIEETPENTDVSTENFDGFSEEVLSLIHISNFRKHQRITGSEADTESLYPGPNYNNKIITISDNQIVDNNEVSEEQSGNTEETSGKHSGRQEGKGKEGKGKEGKGSVGRPSPDFLETEIKNSGIPPPENFKLAAIYGKKFEELNGHFKNLTKIGFEKWKKFVDFIIEKKFDPLFNCHFITPQDFQQLDFPESKWEATLKEILGSGVEPKHNLFFRIPQFLKYVDKPNGKVSHGKSGHVVGKDIVFD